jgi:hypothetical protein
MTVEEMAADKCRIHPPLTTADGFGLSWHSSHPGNARARLMGTFA